MIFKDRGAGQSRPVDLGTLVPDYFVNEIHPYLAPRIDVAYGPDHALWPVAVNEVKAGQALLNLCLNAGDAIPDGGQLSLKSKNIALAEEDLLDHPASRPGEFVRLRISDTGKGMCTKAANRHHTRRSAPPKIKV